MSYQIPSIRLRTIVSAWREDEAGECVEGTKTERVVCVEIDYYPKDTQVQRAKAMAQAIMQALYPAVNSWEIYNTVDEEESPSEVLGYVTGFGGNKQRYESNPVVAFRQKHNPTEYREPDAGTWEEYFAAEDAKRKATPV
jgi:hypothetical protein